MPLIRTTIHTPTSEITAKFDAIRAELDVADEFSSGVEAEAKRTAAGVAFPDNDRTDIPLITIDPDGSKDLDQALHLERDGDGYTVWYAIADVPAAVVPGGLVDSAAHARGQTLYAPDRSVPLHPRIISEDAASLLPGEDRSAYLWRFSLAKDGEVRETTLERARVRSREQLSYPQAQARLDAGDETMTILREVGEARSERELRRGGASLDTPDIEVVQSETSWMVSRRVLLPVERFNAQISLLTGMEAARIQLEGGAGILRTMPAPDDEAIRAFRSTVASLQLPWDESESYGEYLKNLDRADPKAPAVLAAARSLFRGAGYRVIDGTESEGETIQAALATPYSHATAPLRRLVDKYALAHALAFATKADVPEWASDGLDDLPRIMQQSGALASKLEREVNAVVVAHVVRESTSSVFSGVVVSRRDGSVIVELDEPPVEVNAVGEAEPGDRVNVTAPDDADGTWMLTRSASGS